MVKTYVKINSTQTNGKVNNLNQTNIEEATHIYRPCYNCSESVSVAVQP